MAVFDVASKTITLKIVYYGCSMGGKTTNLQTLQRLTDPDNAQGLVSIATNDDRTLFFDLLPVDLGQIGGLSVKVKLYTVPGQVHYELTRRQVIKGADGVVLVIDSSPANRQVNSWALTNLRYNLKANGIDPEAVAIALQWNKRDLPDAVPVKQLQVELNAGGLPAIEAIATTGAGVVETFSVVLKKALAHHYAKSGRSSVSIAHIGETVDRALAVARSREPALARSAEAGSAPPAGAFEHRFDMESYREDEPDRGHRTIVDQETLLSESVSNNMILAEKLEGLGEARLLSDRRGSMMQALSRLAPMLADPAAEALPAGVMKLLVEGCGRQQASLLLFRPGVKVMDEREVVPAGRRDAFNATTAEGLGSLAYRLCQQEASLRVIEDLDAEVFFGAPPAGTEDLASCVIAPVGCDGLAFGVLLVYGRIPEPVFDRAEQEYWKTASCLVGLSLHWHALRRKLSQVAS